MTLIHVSCLRQSPVTCVSPAPARPPPQSAAPGRFLRPCTPAPWWGGKSRDLGVVQSETLAFLPGADSLQRAGTMSLREPQPHLWVTLWHRSCSLCCLSVLLWQAWVVALCPFYRRRMCLGLEALRQAGLRGWTHRVLLLQPVPSHGGPATILGGAPGPRLLSPFLLVPRRGLRAWDLQNSRLCQEWQGTSRREG